MKRFAFAICIGLLTPVISWADIIFTLGNNPQSGEENVLLNNGATGSTVTGTLNQSGLLVNFTSLTQTLTAPSNGQARVEAMSGGNQVALRDISFALANGGTFTDAIFNPAGVGQIGASGTASIVVIANNAQGKPEPAALFSYALGNGNNFLTVTASNGETINSISIAAANGFADLRQVRISGATGPVGTLPDNGSTLALLGGSAIGLALLRRKLSP
jgi:hypothetical protein